MPLDDFRVATIGFWAVGEPPADDEAFARLARTLGESALDLARQCVKRRIYCPFCRRITALIVPAGRAPEVIPCRCGVVAVPYFAEELVQP